MKQKGRRNEGLVELGRDEISSKETFMENKIQQKLNYFVAVLAIVLVSATYQVEKRFFADSVTIVYHDSTK